MKVAGKLTKSEWALLALTAAFLAALGLLYLDASHTAAGTDYTISVQRIDREPPDPQLPAEPEPQGPVDVNTADAAALQTLPGIGPALAERIIAYRTEHGPFRRVEDLLEVKGIGEATLEKFRQEVTVGDKIDDTQEETVS